MDDSTYESEYIAASEASKEVDWLKSFIGDLRVVPTIQEPMELLYYYEGMVSLKKEPKDHDRSKHIHRKYNYIRHRVEGHLLLKRISSKDNVVDPFKNSMSRVKHHQHARRIGLRDDVSFSRQLIFLKLITK